MADLKKTLLADVSGHISRSNSKLGSVKSFNRNNTFDKNAATAKTVTAKADTGFDESKMSAVPITTGLKDDDPDFERRNSAFVNNEEETVDGAQDHDQRIKTANEKMRHETLNTERQAKPDAQGTLELDLEENTYDNNSKVPDTLHEK